MSDPALDLAALARRQLADYDALSPGAMFGEGIVLDEADAYRVQAHVAKLRTARGERIIGYKVGCTSPVMQRQLGIDHCLFGRLFGDERHASGAKLSAAQYDRLAIEGELAVRLAGDLDEEKLSDDLSDGDLASMIAEVFPVIELHNYVILSSAPTPGELIANNGLHAGFVAAEPTPYDQSAASGKLAIHLDGKIVETCDMMQLHETMLSSLRWLADTLPQYDNTLRAGDLILTGSCCRLIPIDSPCHVVVESPYGRVEVEIAS